MGLMSTVSNSQYKYCALRRQGQIRLLKIQPRVNEHRKIQCDLEVVNLEDNPSYVALSYTWGPPTAEAADRGVTGSPSHIIRCNGDIVMVTENLHDFLERAVHNPELNSKKFWIDAVCINQEDDAERASQVSFMASIYRSAEMVLAWIGEEDKYTEKSFSVVKALATHCGHYLTLDVSKNRNTEHFENILKFFADEDARESLKHFWRRIYFKRAWIIQELALAKNAIVHCGAYFVEWTSIVQVSRFLTLTSHGRFLNEGVRDTMDQRHSNHTLPLYLSSNAAILSSKEDWALLYALSRARQFQCSDPRDKVYALLGLQEYYVKDKPRLRPVYGDLSVIDTFTLAAIQILEDTKDLLLLAHVEGENFQRIEGLPSWVPDWSCAKVVGLGMIGYKRFAAAGDLSRSLKIDESNMTLTLRALRLDRVIQVGESKQEALARRNLAYFPNWITILAALPAVYHTGQSKNEVFWRTLITNTDARAPQQGMHPAAPEFGRAFQKWIIRILLRWVDQASSLDEESFLQGLYQLATSAETGFSITNAEEESPRPTKIPLAEYAKSLVTSGYGDFPNADDYDAVFHHSFQTRLLRTSENYLGIATTSVREGDLVWIVPGSRVPLILRETDEQDRYRLVGGAYVHGFMQGEALFDDPIFEDIQLV